MGTKISRKIEVITNISGTNGIPCTGLISLAKNGYRLLDDSIIILDADVSESSYSRLSFKYITKLYDPNNYCIERAVVNYILNRDGSEPLFSEIELSAVKAQFSDCGIDPNNINSQSIDKYKNWHNSHKSFYLKALSAFIRDNKDKFDEWKRIIVKMINKRRANKGLSPIE